VYERQYFSRRVETRALDIEFLSALILSFSGRFLLRAAMLFCFSLEETIASQWQTTTVGLYCLSLPRPSLSQLASGNLMNESPFLQIKTLPAWSTPLVKPCQLK